MRYISTMKANRRPNNRPADPEQPIRLASGFAASEADRGLFERLNSDRWRSVAESGGPGAANEADDPPFANPMLGVPILTNALAAARRVP